MDGVPRFAELPLDASKPPRSAWGVFGDDDEIGTLNRVGPEQIVAAARLVRRGALFSLNWDVDLPHPAILGRGDAAHTVIEEPTGNRDDYYDHFFPQASSQWDALAHVCHPQWGYYNGRTDRDVPPRGSALGIDRWARRGIAGRFVLADVAGARAAAGTPLDCGTPTAIDVDELDAVLAAQGTTTEPGDILLVRFGWIEHYSGLDGEARARLGRGGMFDCPGLTPEERTAAWLWDHGVAAVAADVPALEPMPFDQSGESGFLHFRLIPLLGIAIGEMFALDGLAADCRADGVYEGLFTAAPMVKTGGVGSPANAVALK